MGSCCKRPRAVCGGRRCVDDAGVHCLGEGGVAVERRVDKNEAFTFELSVRLLARGLVERPACIRDGVEDVRGVSLSDKLAPATPANRL